MDSESVSASAILREIPIHAAQRAADEAMMDLFDARDRVRKVIICEGLEDGMGVEQLASTFHLSPDLISSYVAERSNKFSSESVRPAGAEAVPRRLIHVDTKGADDTAGSIPALGDRAPTPEQRAIGGRGHAAEL